MLDAYDFIISAGDAGGGSRRIGAPFICETCSDQHLRSALAAGDSPTWALNFSTASWGVSGGRAEFMRHCKAL